MAATDPSAPRLYTVDDATVAVTLHEPRPAVRVPEPLVHALWHEQRFDRRSLCTTTGAPLDILSPGTPNTDSGPDFIDAHLRIDGMTWRGAVEIHTTSSDWFAHSHHEDPRYNSVVLHVTLHADTWTGGLLRADQSALPELVLAPRLDRRLGRLLHHFHTQPDQDLLCAPQWDRVPASIRSSWIERLARQRMRDKAHRLSERFQARPDWDQLLYERLFAGLGYAKNDAAMETLTDRLPLSLLRRLDDPLDREALAFGTAGLLPAPGKLADARATADHVMALRTRFRRLRARYAIPPMERTQWTFFRLRPANFPPLRLAQGLAWLGHDGLLRQDPLGRLLHAIRSAAPLDALRDALQARPHAFWETHLRLEKPTAPRNPALGKSRIDTLIINAVLPVLLVLADQRTEPELETRVIDALHALPPPRDRVTRRFAALGTRPASAFEAQGMHHLYRRYCQPGHCLSCAIGRSVLGLDENMDG